MEFCGCLGTSICNVWWFVFLVLDPSTLGGHNFLNFILFLMIFCAPHTQIGWVQVVTWIQPTLNAQVFGH
jgi:hypothetical protein